MSSSGDWWSSLSPSTMVKYVKVWKKALSVFLSSPSAFPRDSRVRNLLHVFQHMYNVSASFIHVALVLHRSYLLTNQTLVLKVNRKIAEPRRMPDSDFCILIDAGFLEEELFLWHKVQYAVQLDFIYWYLNPQSVILKDSLYIGIHLFLLHPNHCSC